MRSIEEIADLRKRLALLTPHNAPVPPYVREVARMMAHTLTWLVDEPGQKASDPYRHIASCCCFRRDDMRNGIESCSLGAGNCLCPGPKSARVEPTASVEATISGEAKI